MNIVYTQNILASVGLIKVISVLDPVCKQLETGFVDSRNASMHKGLSYR